MRKENKWQRIRLFSISLLAFTLVTSACGERESRPVEPTFAVMPRGSEETLEIVTWNIENFSGKTTAREVQQIIESLDVDLFAIQEIADTLAFRQLLRDLEDYDGLFSNDVYYGENYQKTGVIYRESLISVEDVGQLFIDDGDAFPRPPLEVTIVAQKDGHIFDFRLIVIHLKAMSGSDELRRRREAAQKLKDYMDAQVASSVEADFVVAGDWNDEIDDPPDDNAFTVFLDDSLNYWFLTHPLAGNPRLASYPSYSSLIDHILISKDAFDEYAGGETTTLRLDEEVRGYLDNVSDHLPVMATFPVF